MKSFYFENVHLGEIGVEYKDDICLAIDDSL